MIQNYKRSSFIWTLVLILFIVRFYRPVFLESTLGSYYGGLKYFIPVGALPFLLCKGKIWGDNFLFNKHIKVYCLLIILNMITCFFFRGQDFIVSLWCWFPFFFILFYPTFNSWNKPVIFWEKIILTLFLIFTPCFILQFIFKDSIELFRLDTNFEYLSIESRVRIFSDSILYLGSFFAFNKYLCKGGLFYLILFAIGSICIFLQGFRMLILCYIIVVVLISIRLKRIDKRFLIMILIGISTIGYISTTKFGQEKVEEMINRNETANFDNDSYVRVALVDYYMNDHFKHVVEFIMGSGWPHINAENPSKAESTYSKECSYRASQFHFYPVDMGLIGLWWNGGLPFAICFTLLFIFIYRIKVPDEYLYLGSWSLFVVIVGISNEISYYHSNVIYLAIVLTLINNLKNKTYLL